MAAILSNIMQVIFAIIVLSSSAAGQISSGYATYSNPGGGVCSGGGGSLPGVSMNAAQFANGAACGQCIQITGSGNGAGTTPVSTSSYVAQITNVCPQCSYGDIDLQESGNGKYGISWSFVGCPGAGRKLKEDSFKGDKTVYTGFAHKGLTPALKKEEAPVPAPVQAHAQNPERPATEETVSQIEFPDVPSKEYSPTEASEAISKTATIELDVVTETFQGQEEQNPKEVVVKTSRRLLMA